MSDYSPTHWMKDVPENFHCEPDKPIRMGLYDPEKGCVRGKPINDCALKIPELLFQSEKLLVDKNLLRNIKDSLESGLDHTRYMLIEHDSSLGRTTRKNKSWAETIESDIRAIEKSIKDLKLVEVENTTTYK